MNIYIDTSNNDIIFILFKNDVLITTKKIETHRNQSEKFIGEFDMFLHENNLTLNDIENYYFAQGPGSFTGIRIGLSFAKALRSSGINNVFVINSLYTLFDNFDNSISIIDARGGKYYVATVNNNEVSQPLMTTDIDDLNKDNLTLNNYNNTSLNKIGENVIKLIKLNKISSDINSSYVKEAF